MKNRKKVILSISFIGLVIILLSSLNSAADEIDVTVSINPVNQIVSPGESFSFTVSCNPSVPVKSFEMKILYDSSLFQVNSVSEGSFFNGFDTFFNHGIIDNDNGRITNIYNLILGAGNVTSENSLISVSCTALSSIGQSSINLFDVGVTDEDGYLSISTNDALISIQDEILLYNANPSNNSQNIDVNVGNLNIDIEHISGDFFNYSIVTSPDIGSCSESFQNNGTKTCSISTMAYDTEYEYAVSVQDVSTGEWTNQSYIFQTETLSVDDLLDISSPSPSNKLSGVSLERSSISIVITQLQGGLFDYTITTSPDIGSVSGTSVNNGTKTCSISGLDYETTYTWIVSVQDISTGGWVNKSFWFTSESEPEDDDPPGGGFPPGGGGGFFPPDPVEGENNAPYKPVKPSGPVYIESGGSFSYTAQTFDPDGDKVRYKFDWGDGNFSDWSEYLNGNQSVIISYTWYQNSNFSVKVIAQDELGRNSSWSESLLVYCSFADDDPDTIKPVAIFEPIINASNDHSFLFNASGSFDEDGNITSFFWDFGDGTTSTEMNPNHTYGGEGWYNVTLIVTDNEGNVFSKTMSVFVASSIDSIDEDTGDESFPWLFVYAGIAIVIGVLFIFRKQLFNMFFEIVEVNNEGNPTEENPTPSGTFLEQVHKVEQKLNPFHSQPGDQHHIPIGFQAETKDQSDETMDQEEKQQHKHRDIHFIRNRIDSFFSDEGDEN